MKLFILMFNDDDNVGLFGVMSTVVAGYSNDSMRVRMGIKMRKSVCASLWQQSIQ